MVTFISSTKKTFFSIAVHVRGRYGIACSLFRTVVRVTGSRNMA